MQEGHWGTPTKTDFSSSQLLHERPHLLWRIPKEHRPIEWPIEHHRHAFLPLLSLLPKLHHPLHLWRVHHHDTHPFRLTSRFRTRPPLTIIKTLGHVLNNVGFETRVGGVNGGVADAEVACGADTVDVRDATGCQLLFKVVAHGSSRLVVLVIAVGIFEGGVAGSTLSERTAERREKDEIKAYILHDIWMPILCQTHIESRFVNTVHKLMTLCTDLAAFWPEFLLDGFVLQSWFGVRQIDMCLVRYGILMIVCKTLVVLWVRIHNCYFKSEAFHSKEIVDGAD